MKKRYLPGEIYKDFSEFAGDEVKIIDPGSKEKGSFGDGLVFSYPAQNECIKVRVQNRANSPRLRAEKMASGKFCDLFYAIFDEELAKLNKNGTLRVRDLPAEK